MKVFKKQLFLSLCVLAGFLLSIFRAEAQQGLVILDNGYFEMPGLNVLVFNNSYSEGHQGGIEIIQHDNRIATGGNMRLSPAPGQWQPVPMLGEGFEKVGCSPQQIGLMSRKVDKENNEISLNCSYPDSGRMEKGFNPIIYPDLELKYYVSVKAEGNTFTIRVDLENPLPEEWVGRVGYNLEFFPGDLYGKSFNMDGITGIFPRQANGPVYFNEKNEAEAVPLASGNKLVIVPENDRQRVTLESKETKLQLLDGSLKHNNGWFVVRSLIPANTTKGAIVWKITPHVIADFVAEPVLHVSQVGYHPGQNKTAFLELDKRDESLNEIALLKINADGTKTIAKSQKPEAWGRYLRYEYYTFDFSEIKEKGMYQVRYGDKLVTNVFPIDPEVYERHVWQPTLEYFLPVQMCHMRINQKYRVWHGACHLDDALMAPVNIAHFDGYNNTNETGTLAPFEPLEPIPGMNVGGWHDAGDYDIRVESQSSTLIALVMAYEEFDVDYDATFIDQENRHVEIHQPDGKPDILQQIEHGTLTLLAGYEQLGQLYRGIIVPTLRQYVHLGDGVTQTDNKVFDNKEMQAEAAAIDGLWYKEVANRYSNVFDPELFNERVKVYAPELDDRLLFTETNPRHQMYGAAALAASSRALKEYNPELSQKCLEVAEALYAANKSATDGRVQSQKILTLTELYFATKNKIYLKELDELAPHIDEAFPRYGWAIARISGEMEGNDFAKSALSRAKVHKMKLDSVLSSTPFGIPLEGAEYIGFSNYFLNKTWPEIYDTEGLFNAVNYIFGCRPGNTTNSLISGVGAESPTIAYGSNRADWSYIPGGTFWNSVNLVSPDFAEDKVWPFLWQEREYIISSPCYHMFSVLAVRELLEN